MCYLIRKGCPWKKTFNRAANQIINNETYRNILMAYSSEADPEDAGHLLQPCILCGSIGVSPGIVDDCGHSCAQICFACVSRVKNCPECYRHNKGFDRKQKSETDTSILPDLTYSKNSSQPSTKPIALSSHNDTRQSARQPTGYPTSENIVNDPFFPPQPSTSQQFGYENQNYNSIFPAYGHPNDDWEPSTSNGAYPYGQWDSCMEFSKSVPTYHETVKWKSIHSTLV